MAAKESAHLLHFMQTKKQPEETPLVSMEGWIGEMMGKGKDQQHNGCLILTEKRVVFSRKGVFGEVFQAMPLDKMSSVETKSSMGYRVLTMHTSNDELRFKTFEPAQKFEWTYNRIEELRHATSAVAPTSTESPLDMLSKLAALRDAGVLTDEEFDSKKRDLLAKI